MNNELFPFECGKCGNLVFDNEGDIIECGGCGSRFNIEVIKDSKEQEGEL